MNKPFKNGERNGYRDHIEELFQEHLRNGKDPTLFAPKLTMGALKPFLTGFVQSGIEALKTPEMRETIKNAFAKDGLFTQIRSPEMQLTVQLAGVDLARNLDPDVINEPDCNSDGEIDPHSASEDGNDID